MLYIGLDEAGYGPALGPLCIGLCALRLPEKLPEECPIDKTAGPDIWNLLSPVVGRGKSKAPFWVDDSKKVYTSRSKSGELQLLKTLSGFVSQTDPEFDTHKLIQSSLVHKTDRENLNSIPWYSKSPSQTPLPCTESEVSSLKNQLSEAGVEVVRVQVRAVSAEEFNKGVKQNDDNKLRFSWSVMSSVLNETIPLARENETIWVVCDKLSGQRFYAPLLESCFPGVPFWRIDETAEWSRYRMELENGNQLKINFVKKADQKSFPTALASMAAKAVREACMAELNDFFKSHIKDLKPTSGYRNPSDAPPFLEATKKLREKLAIPDPEFIRQK